MYVALGLLYARSSNDASAKHDLYPAISSGLIQFDFDLIQQILISAINLHHRYMRQRRQIKLILKTSSSYVAL